MIDRALPSVTAAALAVFVLGPATTSAQNATTQNPAAQSATSQNATTEAPLKALFQSSILDMELARLASSRAASAELKQFADTVINDQKAVNVQLSFLADSNHLHLSCGLDAWGQKIVNELGKKTGGDFDRVYAKEALAAEEKFAQLMNDQIERGQNPDIRNFARRFLPTSNQHAQVIRALGQQLAGG